MTSSIGQITFDAHDPVALARWWAGALGYVEDPANPNERGDPEAYLIDPDGRGTPLRFVTVPEGTTARNRVHLDLVPVGTRDDEVARLVATGATRLAEHPSASGGWVVLADPEGNEVCIERSAAERVAPAPVDTGERAMLPDRTLDELGTLTGLLEWYREGVLVKVEGLSARHASAAPLRSATTIAGLVKHLALVEDSWMTHRFAGHPEPEPWASAPWDDDRDWEFTSAPREPFDDVVALYRAACERSRAVVTGHGPEDLAALADPRPFNLRFVLAHLVEETARHLGHLDVLRELLDGTVGE
jgi:hypothetical protein